MNRRELLLGVSAAALAQAVPLPARAVIPATYTLDDRRPELPDTHRFRYYTDGD